MEDENIIFNDIYVEVNYLEEFHPRMTNLRRQQYYNVETFNSLALDNTDLKLLHLNIRSFNTSIEYFNAVISELKCKFDAMCITECWLNQYTKQLHNFPGFTAYYSLRPNNLLDGGIAVFVSD